MVGGTGVFVDRNLVIYPKDAFSTPSVFMTGCVKLPVSLEEKRYNNGEKPGKDVFAHVAELLEVACGVKAFPQNVHVVKYRCFAVSKNYLKTS